MSQTVMKVNVSMQIVKQSGDKFIFSEPKLGTKNQIRKYEVGACYFDSKVARTKAYELICDNPDDVLTIRDTIHNARLDIKDYLISMKSGCSSNGESQTIGDLLNYIHNLKKTGNTVNKVSPYSVQIKVTMQHIVPKDVTVDYPERYHENANWYSSSTQALEVRVPLVPYLDSNPRLDEIFAVIIRYFDEIPQLNHSSKVSRPTQEVIRELIGLDRFRKLLGEKKDNQSSQGSESDYQLDEDEESLFDDNHNDSVADFNNPGLDRS